MRLLSIATLLTTACLLLGTPVSGAAERPFAVIANPEAATHRLSQDTLARIYRRKQTYWENGTRIQPVNLPPTHPLRRAFSQTILGSLPEDMEEYWREMYFHGVLPPHVLASEEAVVLFVGATPGAIGYVSTCVPAARPRVGRGGRALRRRDPGRDRLRVHLRTRAQGQRRVLRGRSPGLSALSHAASLVDRTCSGG